MAVFAITDISFLLTAKAKMFLRQKIDYGARDVCSDYEMAATTISTKYESSKEPNFEQFCGDEGVYYSQEFDDFNKFSFDQSLLLILNEITQVKSLR